jgi:hypothetical protein
MQPVEGYSNTVWVLMLGLLSTAGLLDPIVAPKIVAAAAVAAAFWLLYRLLATHVTGGVALLSLSLLALQPAFVIWTNSGLENSLTALWTALLAVLLVAIREESLTSARAGVLAFTVFGFVLTRPEALIYAFAVPFIYLIQELVLLKREVVWRALIVYGAVLLSLLGGFFLFRYSYFHDVLPNVYYAKGGVRLGIVTDIALLQPGALYKVLHLFAAVFGSALAMWGLLLSGWLAIKATREARLPTGGSTGLFILSCLSAVGLASYLVLPDDWMGEYRFATSFFAAFYPSLVISLWIVASSLRKGLVAAWTIGSLGLIVLTLWVGVPRTNDFKLSPAIPMEEVVYSANRYVDYTVVTKVDGFAVLTADIGGLLWLNEFRVVDLGMLTDRVIAESIGEWRTEPDRELFYDYILETVRPEYISTRAFHSWRAHLDGDKRFREQYVPIVEYTDTWILARYGVERMSGDYVRKDVLLDTSAQLDALRVAAQKYHFFGCAHCEPRLAETESE